MCPVCLTTAALAVTGASSAGGLTALAVRKLRTQIGAMRGTPTTDAHGGQHESSKSRLARCRHHDKYGDDENPEHH
jgi:hypothetical protein